MSKGLNFSIPPTKLNYADCLTPYELLYRNVKNLDVDSNTLDSIKARIRDTAFSTFNNYDHRQEQNLSAEELKAIKVLQSNTNLVIQQSDKGNSVVLIDKYIYEKKMKDILSDTSKFVKLIITPGKDFNKIINQERKIKCVLKTLLDKKSICSELYKKIMS